MTRPDPAAEARTTTPSLSWEELLGSLYRFRFILLLEVIFGAVEVAYFQGELPLTLKLASVLAFGVTTILVGRTMLRALAGRSLLPRFGMRHLMLFVLVAAVLFQLFRSFGVSLILLVLMMVPPVVAVLIVLGLIDRRPSQQEGLLGVLAMAARRGLPLGPAADAFAGLCSGRHRRLARALAAKLEAGTPLPEALNRLPDALPRGAATMAAAGWRAGTLGPSLEAAHAAELARRRDGVPSRWLVAYPLLIIFAVVQAALFLMGFMVPRIDAIFRDFSGEVPVPGRTLLDVMVPISRGFNRWLNLVSYDSAALAFINGLFVGTALTAALFALGWQAWVRSRKLLGLVVGQSAPRDASTVLRGLAAGIQGGRTLPEALADLDGRDLSGAARRRAYRARVDVIGGRPWVEALRVRSLISPADAAVLESAARAGNLPWALLDRADAADRRRAYRQKAAAQVLYPLALLALGGLVLLFGLVYFQPLAQLISTMAEEA